MKLIQKLTKYIGEIEIGQFIYEKNKLYKFRNAFRIFHLIENDIKKLWTELRNYFKNVYL